MHVVMNISEDVYKHIKEMNFYIPDIGSEEKGLLNIILYAIRTSTPLPKGHGVLKDTEELKRAFIMWSMAVQGNFTDADIASIICNASPIVEADKESEE